MRTLLAWGMLIPLEGAAWAGPPPKTEEAPDIEIIPQFLEGPVKLTMPGRDGDDLFIDGWPAGKIPLVTQLAEGPHTFRLEGAAGKLEIQLYVTIAEGGAVREVDLSTAKPEAAPKPPEDSAKAPKTPAPAPR